MRYRLTVGLVAVAGMVLAACGGGGRPKTDEAATVAAAAAPLEPSAVAPGVPRRVEIEMVDIGFKPTSVDVKLGETVSFVLINRGQIPHDAFLGDEGEQEEHEKEMRAMKDPNDHAGHEGGITVDPGQTGALRHTFTDPGTLEIGCHQSGHYAAGMKVTIKVA